jgi:hypothetical protein
MREIFAGVATVWQRCASPHSSFNNPNWSAFAISSRHTAAIPSSVAEIFDDDFPILHATIMRVYDESGNVIATREHTGDFKEW